MKALCYRKNVEKAKLRKKDEAVEYAVRFLTFESAEILLDKFKWKPDRVSLFLHDVWNKFDITKTKLVNITDYSTAENFGYEVNLKNTIIQPTATQAVRYIQSCEMNCLRAMLEVMVYSLKDTLEWGDTMSDRYVHAIDRSLTRYRAPGEFERIEEKLKEDYRLSLRMFLT